MPKKLSQIDSKSSASGVVFMNISNKGTLTISATGATLYKPDVEPENFFIEESDIDITHVTDINLRTQLLPFLQNYTQQKSKDINVQMKILLTG